MKRCAVVIGVNKTLGFPTLTGAVEGAEGFALWAAGQDIDVSLIIDTQESRVNHHKIHLVGNDSVQIAQIMNAVGSYVDQAIYSQIIVYYGGHGILLSQQSELWLLSDAISNPNEAVNVALSIYNSRDSRIPHVVFISDACRTTPGDIRLNLIQGSVIFPIKEPRYPRSTVDVFYATLPGDPAKEVKGDVTDPNGNRRYKGFFTDAILKGLKGDVPEAIVKQQDANSKTTRWVVPAYELKTYLEAAVPLAVGNFDESINQYPDIRVESRLPKILSEVIRPPAIRGFGNKPTIKDGLTLPNSHHLQIIRSLEIDNFFIDELAFGSHRKDIPSDMREAANNSALAETMNLVLKAKGRQSFESGTGFTVIGTNTVDAITTSPAHQIFQEDEAYQIQIGELGDSPQGQTIVITFDDGRGIPLAIMPGYIGTVVVQNQSVVNVSYVPSQNTEKYHVYQSVANEIERRRAFAAAAATNGSFRFENRDYARKAARYMRVLKALDPTLGLYATYAYAQAGEYDSVHNVLKYMTEEIDPIFFDVMYLNAMAAQHSEERKGFIELIEIGRIPWAFYKNKIAPFCPMLTQGWVLMNETDKDTILPVPVRQAGRYLIPGLWTTFTPEGVKILSSAFNSGELQ